MAKLYFHYATMNAGKSTLLLQASYNYRERGMETFLLTSEADDRGQPNQILSRIGIENRSDSFGESTDLFALIERRMNRSSLACVFVDEAQFLTREQVRQLARVADDLLIPVMCYGLRVDFRGKLFPGFRGTSRDRRRSSRVQNDMFLREKGDHGRTPGCRRQCPDRR